jgi:hypothetical protein
MLSGDKTPFIRTKKEMTTKPKEKRIKEQITLYRKDGTEAGFYDGICWWLNHYEGLEHFFFQPPIAYTLTTILGKVLKKIERHSPEEVANSRKSLILPKKSK